MSRRKKKEGILSAGAGKFAVGHPMATFKRILSYFKPYKGRVILAGISLVLNVAATVGGTFMLSVIIDDYIGPLASGSSAVTMGDFAMMTGVMASLYPHRRAVALCLQLDHRQYDHQDPAQYPRSDVREYAEAPRALLRHPRQRRYNELLHQRHRQPCASSWQTACPISSPTGSRCSPYSSR